MEVQVPVDALDPVGDGVAGLVWADEEAVELAAGVARGAGVPVAGQLDGLGGGIGVGLRA